MSPRRAGLAGLLVAAALLLPSPALAGTFRVFGPQDFLRGTGAPVTETRSVTVPNPATAFTLTIYNGGMQDAEFERVSSSVITVNGVQVVGPSEFNQTIVWVAKPVILQATNVLSVELRGKPTGQVTLVIDGVDNDPPAITASLDQAPNAAGWHHADVTVRFACTDAISGVASCPAPVVVRTEGSQQVVTGTATDLAGNTASTSVAIHLDTTPPVLTSTLTPAANAAGWSQADTTVTFAATDTLSGVATTSEPVLVTTEGAAQGVTGTATDVAGNSATLSTTVQLDRTPPTLTPVVTPAPNAAGWHRTDVTVTFTATDSLSGIATAPPPVVVTTDGQGQLVQATVTDAAGNSATASVTLNVDTTPPTITAAVTPPPNAAGWHQAAPTVTFTCDDLLSGLATCPTPVTVVTEGAAQAITGTATDVAGNSANATATVSLDTTAPVVTITAPPEGAFIPTPSVTVTGTVSEAVASLTVNDVPATVTAGAFTVEVPLTLSTTTLVAVATDPAGHSGSATRTITLDTTPPVVRILTPATGQVLRTPTVTVTGTLDDPTATVTVNGVAATLADGRFTAAGVALGAGATVLTAEARDPAGNLGTDQVSVTFDGTPPTVTLTAPAAVTAGLPVALEVQATDNVGLATIDLLVDGRLVASGATSPVGASVLVSPDRAVGDTLTVTARAVDLAGAVTQQLAPAETALAAPAGLTLRLPEALQALLPPGSTVPAAWYDPGPQAWVALAPGTVTADGLAVEVALPALGQLVLLKPDAAPHTPPAAVAGQPLAGVAVVAIPETATAASELTPKAVPPGQTTATMAIGLASAAPLPSGTTVQAVVRETYTLRSGGAVTPPGFTQDVVLYACDATGCGPTNTLGARIPVTPSKRFTLQELAVGSVTVAVQTPEAEGPGTLIGPAGGSVTASDGTVLTIPATALASETVVALTPVPEAELRVGRPAGVEVLRAVRLDLTRATLSLTAELAFPVPEGLAPTDQVLVARVLEVDGLLRLQVVALGRLDGGLVTSRGAVTGASLPGLTSGGTFVFLRATSPVGFVTGTVRDAAGAARPGVVVTSAAGFVDVSRADGRYVLATTAGSVTVTADDAATGQGAVQPVTVTAGAATTQPLQVATIPPQVVRVAPAAGTTNVPVQTQVEVTFSKPVARTSVTAATLVLSSAAGLVDTVVTLSATGAVATLYPTTALAPQTTYTLQATTGITDAQGAPLAAPFTSPFTTVDTTPPPPPAAGAITVSFPDLDNTVTVTATQGTAEPGALVTVLNLSSGSVASATVRADGSFTATLFAFLGDELVVVIKDAAGNQTVVSPGPYTSATGEFVVTAQGGTVEGAGGVRVTVPAGALVGPATVKVSALTQADLPAPLPQGETFAGGVRIASDQPFTTDVKVTVPIPAGMTIAPNARPYLARFEEIDGIQTPVMIDSLRVVGGELTTSSPPFLGVLFPGDYFAFLPPLPLPALVSGVVSRRTVTGGTEPVAGAVVRAGKMTARPTGADGRWALYVYPKSLDAETFIFTAVDPVTRVAQSKSVTVPVWTADVLGTLVPGGVYTLNFTLDPAPAEVDLTPPVVTVTVSAPSLKDGRVQVGDEVTVTVRATDDRGVRPDTVTLTLDGRALQVARTDPGTGPGMAFTAHFPASTLSLYHLIATGRDATGNQGVGQSTLQAIDLTPPPSLPGAPAVLTSGIVPADQTTEVDVFTEIRVPFSEGMLNTSLSETTVVVEELDPAALATGVQRPVGAPVPVILLRSGAVASTSITLRPERTLEFGTPYRLTVTAGLQDQEQPPETLGQDVTTRFTTQALSRGAFLSGNIRDVERLDRYAILLDRAGGVRVVDVADPTRPQELTAAPVKPFQIAGIGAYQAMAVVQNLVYDLPDGTSRRRDLALVVGWRSVPDLGIQGVLGVVDVTTRTKPVRVGETILSDHAAGLPLEVLTVGRHALVASVAQGVLVVDLAHALAVIEQPAAFPLHQRASLVGLYDFDLAGALPSPFSLVRYRQSVLAAELTHGLYRLDLGALPGLTGQRLLPGRIFRLQVVEQFPVRDPVTGQFTVMDLALISNTAGLTIVRLDGPAGPEVLQTLSLPGGAPFAIAVDRARSLVFLTNGFKGLTVVDLRLPAAPVVVGSHTDAELGFANGGVALDPQFAFVAGAKGLRLVAHSPAAVRLFVRIGQEDRSRSQIVLSVNDTATLTAYGSPFGIFPGQPPPAYAWASADPTVATVAVAPGQPPTTHPNQALLTAKTVGTTTVTVTFTAPSGATYTTTATVTILPPALVADYDRNGMIDTKDEERVAAKTPVSFWLNDDHDDDGDQVDDEPGQGPIRLASTGADSADLVVNAIGDLVDFFPVRVNARALLGLFPKDDYDYVLMHADAAVNARETTLRPESTNRLDGPRAYLRAISVAQSHVGSRVHRVGTSGLLLSQEFLDGVKEGVGETDGRGVVLLEAVKKSDKPLILEIRRKTDGEPVYEAELPLHLDGVEQMFRHVNLNGVLGPDDSLPIEVLPRPPFSTVPADSPPNWPDGETNGKWVVFVHGFNVDQRSARGSQAEMFKRLYQSGSNARFVGVSWNGTHPINYHRDVINAFVTSQPLASALSAVGVGGDVTVMAHSLGNVVVSSAVMQGFSPTRYFMINAAVPIEAFNDAELTAEMVRLMRNPDWALYAERLWVSNWWNLFPADDHRRRLTWRNRFQPPAGVAFYNFYSPGDEVLQNNSAESIPIPIELESARFVLGRRAWAAQEMVKGLSAFGLIPLGLLMPDQHGGWGFNSFYSVVFPLPPELASGLTPEELRVQPFFAPFVPKTARFPEYDGVALLAPLGDSAASAQAARPETQYKLLAEAIPALSFATGANPVGVLNRPGETRNFDIQTLRNDETPTAWPANRGDDLRWLHTDMKAVPYSYIYKLFDQIVKLGRLNE